MGGRVEASMVPSSALEVTRKSTGEVVGWIWEESADHMPGHRHWRFATKTRDGAYISPFGFQYREHAFARVASVKGVILRHLRLRDG